MTRARKVLVADRCSPPSSSPIGVNGPIMKTSSSPITSGGSSRLQSTPASQTRGNGSVPRASIRASGVPSKGSTARVTAPDLTEMISGSSAPGAVSELTMALPDRCVSRVMPGPTSAIQIRPAPAMETAPDTERMARGTAADLAGPAGRCCPGESPPGTAPPAAAAGLAAQLTRYRCRDSGAGDRRLQQRESPRLVLGQAGLRERVLDERDRGRGGLADDRNVNDLRRASLHRLDAADRDGDRRLAVLRGVSEAAEVDGGRKRDIRQVQLDRLRDERAGGIQLAGLQRRIQRGLVEDLW